MRFKKYFQLFCEMREEIMKHKWIESEKEKRDIGFDAALTDWMKNHRKKWLESKQQQELTNE